MFVVLRSCMANLQAVDVRQSHSYARIVMLARRDIASGEEVTLDYVSPAPSSSVSSILFYKLACLYM